MTPTTTLDEPAVRHIVRDTATRAVAAVGLAGIGLIHLLDSIGKYGEVRYMFWMYIALIISSLGVAFAVIHVKSRMVFAAAGLLAASVLAGFIIDRTVGMPNATGDIGNWSEPLGLASLFVEGLVVAVSAYGFALASAGRRIAGRATGTARNAQHGMQPATS